MSSAPVSTKPNAPVEDKPTDSSRDAVRQVRAWLDKRVQIKLTDGRVVEGIFECFDKLGNMILGDAYELKESRTRFPLGLVLAPEAAIVKIRVRRSIPPAAESLINSLSIGDTL